MYTPVDYVVRIHIPCRTHSHSMYTSPECVSIHPFHFCMYICVWCNTHLHPISHAFTRIRFHPCQRVMGTLYIHLCKYLVDSRYTCTHTLLYTRYTRAHGHLCVTKLHLCTHLGIFECTHYTSTHTLVFTNYMSTYLGIFVYTRYTWAHARAPLYIHITHVHTPLYTHVTHVPMTCHMSWALVYAHV